ncbi:MAG: hypothetical protein J6W16_07845 [Methanobrevibacter sp.]|nr:hypothetical protein [Methanobrevibacter sp.]
MTLTITKGMDGKRVETIGKYTAEQIEKMDKDFAAWKKSKKAQEKYRIQWYDRVIYKPEEKKLVIDFGDYSYFGLVKANMSEWKALEEHRNKPIKLEV